MPYVTYIQRNTAVFSEGRMTTVEMIQAELFGLPDRSLHSKNFFHVRTFWTDNPRHDDAMLLMLNELVRCIRVPFTKEYCQFRIPKASGGTRLIEAPAPTLKATQKAVANALYALDVFPHDAAYAYTRGRCAYDALVTHQRANARWFLKIDIKDFFPSITKALLESKLKEIYPLNYIISETFRLLSDMATNAQDVLPQGSPLSPVLSNLIMMGFDKKLTKALKRFERQSYCYTRYADDILISCPYSFRFEPIVELVQSLFAEEGLPFRINRDKLRYSSMAGRNWNLGLMYNQEQQITVGTKRKRQLHALVHNFLSDYTNDAAWSKSETQELIGKLAYLKNIEPAYHDNLIRRYESKFYLDFRTACKIILNGDYAHTLPMEDLAHAPAPTPAVNNAAQEDALYPWDLGDDEPLF